MPETDSEQGQASAERLRKTIENTVIKVSHPVGELKKTASIGVTFLNEMGDSGQNLLKRADEALYKAKNSGRNKVVSAEAE